MRARGAVSLAALLALALSAASCSESATSNPGADGGLPPFDGPEDRAPADAGPGADPASADRPGGDAGGPGRDGRGGDAWATSPGCGEPAPIQADSTWTLTHEGLKRQFLVHVPPSYQPGQPTPLVLNFHGFGSNATQQELLSGLVGKSDQAGFIAVHPEGTGLMQSWNAGLCCGEALDQNRDDVGFVAAMLDALGAKLCVDPRRVYATGMSNGGFFSHRLGCELSDRIAAIAPVAGVMGLSSCTPGRAVPVMHFHGTADPLVPYDGGSPLMWPAGGPIPVFPSVPSTFMGWATRDGCRDPAPTETYQQGDATCQTFSSCSDGALATLCTIEGGGHTWPGGLPVPVLGKTSTDINATDHAWQFFSDHPL